MTIETLLRAIAVERCSMVSMGRYGIVYPQPVCWDVVAQAIELIEKKEKGDVSADRR